MKEPSNFEFRLWQLIRNTYNFITKARQKEINRCYDISLPSLGIMHAVVSLDKKATPAKIARQLFKGHNSISEHLSRMVEEGLVRKVKDLERKNQVRVELTEKGYELFEKVRQRKSIEYIMTALTWEEQRELWSLLARLREKAMEYLGLENIEPYPPSEIDKIPTSGYRVPNQSKI